MSVSHTVPLADMFMDIFELNCHLPCTVSVTGAQKCNILLIAEIPFFIMEQRFVTIIKCFLLSSVRTSGGRLTGKWSRKNHQ